ncbi:hypothetical protein ElyMa_002637500 [Elysia marginata]|uniref:Uncharacterized protein n=1 Tax=Elysia marginata TaxID=1093978 RepID=A0AAV4H6E5_9GAST|nr:hypothetical protein ElyMa_002637500 [Elysia marginata]
MRLINEPNWTKSYQMRLINEPNWTNSYKDGPAARRARGTAAAATADDAQNKNHHPKHQQRHAHLMKQRNVLEVRGFYRDIVRSSSWDMIWWDLIRWDTLCWDNNDMVGYDMVGFDTMGYLMLG